MGDGKDLIFAMGAPGSRWSGTLRAIQMYHACINHSDDRPERTYDRYSWDNITNTEESVGWHRGAYWGPAHEFGGGFDNIKENYTKETFFQECKKPFDNWDGVKIIKSHWFAYNIDILRDWFPDSKLIAIKYGSDLDTFAWWHYVGGWEIPYPHYDWYENNEKMLKQISIENELITNQFDCHYNLNMKDINQLLGIDDSIRPVEEMWEMDTKLSERHPDKSLERHLRIINMISQRCAVGVI